jgi:Ca2+-binding RTX toxin-like protein
MFFETIEPRLCLTATLDPATGILTVTGTDQNDRIIIRRGDNDTIAVLESVIPPRPAAGERPTEPTVTKTLFPRGDVDGIVVNAGEGADAVSLAWRVRIPRLGMRLRALEIPSTLNGGNGSDYLRGGRGIDQINGGDGRDQIIGLSGADLLNGDAGNDDIDGGLGADILNGGAGNDRLFGLDGSGTDSLDGGDNDPVSATNPGDVAFVNTGDTVVNVERTRLPGGRTA